MRDTFVEYIIARIIERADEVKLEEDKDQFDHGRVMAFYEVLDIMKSELVANGYSLRDFGLDLNLEEYIQE